MTHKKEIEYEGNLQKLYGLRLRTYKDLKIKEGFELKSQRTNKPIDRLILDALYEKLTKEEIILNDQSIVTIEKYNSFNKNLISKLESLRKKYTSRNYEEKESLRTFIYNYFPDKIERNYFFMKTLLIQISAEIYLFDILYTLKEPSMNDRSIDYFSFHCHENNITSSTIILEKINENLKNNLIYEWYLRLKINHIVSNFSDFKLANINIDSLEEFFFTMYKGHKILYQMNNIENTERLLSDSKKKRSKKPLKYLIKDLFQELVKVNFKDLPFRILEFPIYEKNFKDRIVHKIGFKPSRVFNEVLRIEKYYKYIKNNMFQSEAFYSAINSKCYLYSCLSDSFYFPPNNLLMYLSFYFSDLEALQDFFKEIEKNLQNHSYNAKEIEEIKQFLIIMNKNNHPYFKKINFKRLYKIPESLLSIYDIIPENYDKILNLLSKHLERNKDHN